MEERPYGPIDPNSEHQMWSRWTFIIWSPKKLPSVKIVADNARRYFGKAFKSTVGRVKCARDNALYRIVLEIEGPPAHDTAYVHALKKDFEKIFMARGFGYGAVLSGFEVGVLAGNKEDGKPPDQMIVMPHLASTAQVFVPGG